MTVRSTLARLLPSPLTRSSALLHLGAAASLIARPRAWPWAVGAVVADHLLLAGSGLLPRSALLGPNLTRLPEPARARRAVALTIDDGPDPEVTPQVLAILDRSGARATFFCIGRQVASHPELAREIVARGHALENHSYSHRHDFSLLGPRRIAQEIGEAQSTIRAISGSAPSFFRAPAGLRSPLLEPALARAGLALVSWTRRGFDTVSGDPCRVLERLTRDLAAGDILLLHDGHAARTRSGAPVILEVLPRLLDTLAAAGLATVTLRSATAGRAQ